MASTETANVSQRRFWLRVGASISYSFDAHTVTAEHSLAFVALEKVTPRVQLPHDRSLIWVGSESTYSPALQSLTVLQVLAF